MKFKNIQITILTILALSTAAIPTKALATDGYVGGFLGPSFVNNDFGTGVMYGVRLGWRFSDSFSFGFYASHQSLFSAQDDFDDTFDFSATVLATEANFYPMYGVPIYIGMKFGMGILSGTLQDSDDPYDVYEIGHPHTSLAVGPAIGFDVPVAENFSMGGEFSAIFLLGSGETLNLINVAVTGNFHF